MLEIRRRSEEARAAASEGTAPQTTCEHRANAVAGAQMHGTPAAKLNAWCGPGRLKLAERGDVRTCAQQPEGRRCGPLRAASGVKRRRGRQGGRGTARAEARRPLRAELRLSPACGGASGAPGRPSAASPRPEVLQTHKAHVANTPNRYSTPPPPGQTSVRASHRH